MSLFQLKWLRRFIRKNTNPIPFDRANRFKQRLSLMYMLIGWNAFGFVCYMVYIGRSDWAKYHGLKSEVEANLAPAQQWSKTLGIDNAKVYRFSGFKKTQEYDIKDGEIVRSERKTEPESEEQELN